MKKIIPIVVGAALVTILDQASKFFVSTEFPQFIYKNPGAAFGFPVHPYFSITIAIFIIFAGIFAAYKYLNFSKKITVFALSFAIGGTVGNLIDRALYGYVIDFISIWLWPVFNFADTFITIGILMIIAFYDKIKRV